MIDPVASFFLGYVAGVVLAVGAIVAGTLWRERRS